jgi:hypothetical protein
MVKTRLHRTRDTENPYEEMRMNKIISAFCAAAMSVTFTAASFAPVQAAPVFVPKTVNASSDVINVQERSFRRDDKYWQPNRHVNRRDGWRNRDRGWNRGGWDNRRNNYGRRHYRNHDRNLGGAAIGGLITGAIIGGVLNNNNNARSYRGGDSHIQWCYDRYRSYRASDNTFQPYNGPRQQCYSPY